MRAPNTVNFYGGKPSSLPRFVYRRLMNALRGAPPEQRAQALNVAFQELTTGSDPDLRKFKFVLPPYLSKALTSEEAEAFRAKLAARRAHAARLRMVYPHVADEFSLDRAFLDAALDVGHGPELAARSSFFTIGSCFARNIAEFLKHNGIEASTFALAEDLNSPISNAFIFDVLRRDPAERASLLAEWTRKLFPGLDEAQTRHAVDLRLASLEQLAGSLRTANCVILTLGNVVDFFQADAAPDAKLMDKVVPKFLAMPGNEDIEVRSGAAARLKAQGAVLRLASYDETREAIRGCLEGIRALTAAPIVVTLSPVPVDSVIGLASTLGSAIEVDCVSKSRLRSAFDEEAARFGLTVGYFPSFEIVRWIAPMLPIPNFGLDDAASRHVSSPVLDAICGLFVERYIRWREPVSTAAQTSENA